MTPRRFTIHFRFNGAEERAVVMEAPDGSAETALLKAGVALVRSGILPFVAGRTDLRVTKIES